MAEITLGQMLDKAIGAPKTEPIDFEQLRNLLNGMLIHLGLYDVPMQESGEPLEGTPSMPSPASVAADMEMLKQKIEANEKEIAEVRALCEELRVEINEIKEEQSHMADNMEKMQESLGQANLQDMLDNLRSELLDNLRNEVLDNLRNEGLDGVMSSVKGMTGQGMTGQDGQVSSDWQEEPGMHSQHWDDHGLIVIGNEMALAQRSRALSPKPDASASSPVPWKSKARAQSRGHELPGVMSSPRTSFMDTGWDDVGQNNMGPIKDKESKTGISKGAAFPRSKAWSRGKNLLPGATSSHRVSFTGSDMGWDDMAWNDMGQMKDKEIKMGISKGAALPSSQAWSREKNLPHGVTSSPQDAYVESDEGWSDVEQIEDEEIQTSIPKAESLPSHLGAFPEMNDMEDIKDKVTEMSVSKRKSLDGSATAPGVPPGSPSTQVPIQQVQSVGHHPAPQTLWIPAESVAGTDSRFLTAKEAQGGGSSRMEPSQIKPGMRLLKVSTLEFLPCDQPFTTPGPYSPPGSPPVSGRSPPSPGSPALPRRSDIASFTPPPSPGLTGRLPHLAKQELGPRGQAADGYFRRSPMYCGGRHTSLGPVQRMEPLFPDPSKPGAFDLVGRDGHIYRGRHSTAPTGSWMAGESFSNLQ